MEEADRVLRAMQAGYLSWGCAHPGGPEGWVRTWLAMQLCTDALKPRISRAQADHILGEVLARAQAINADPNRLSRVSALLLYGSALHEDRPDYGDVDLDPVVARRPLTEARRDEIKIAPLVPASTPNGPLGHMAEEVWDANDRIKRELSRSLKGLSLSQGAVERLGCEHWVVLRWDTKRDR